MTGERIDFIAAYCDGWCERCAFTARCSVFAVAIATAMCGDEAEGLELAVGRPHPDWEQSSEEPAWHAGLEDFNPTPEEIAEVGRLEDQRRTQIEGTAIMTAAWRLHALAHPWFAARYDSLRATADPVLNEALEMVARDVLFVAVKLHRALEGRQRIADDGLEGDHPVQNDWNGSAKVALISLERSEAAWGVIAQATGDDVPASLTVLVSDLRRLVQSDFPNAMLFIRPGFDEPGR